MRTSYCNPRKDSTVSAFFQGLENPLLVAAMPGMIGLKKLK